MAKAPSSNDVNTYGWDTVFALNYNHANAAVVAGWSKVNAGAKNVAQTANDDPSFNLAGVLGPWQLTLGGDGKNVRMNCPFASGTYNHSSGSTDLTGVGVVIEIMMEWVPDPGQFHFVIGDQNQVPGIKSDLNNAVIDAALNAAFAAQNKPLSASATVTMITSNQEWVIQDGTVYFYVFLSSDKFGESFLNFYQYETAWQANMQALAKAVSADEPAVSIITITNDPLGPGIAADVLQQLLSDWFNTNIGEFNHVFAMLDISPLIDSKSQFTWMKPTATSYAVSDQGTMESSTFGVLTMVENNVPGDNHQVDPNAIPPGADAGFLISGPNFIKYMMLAGAQTIFNNALASSFDITNDGLTVQNNDRILFGKFHLDDDPTTSVSDDGYSAQLDAGTLPQGLIQALGRGGVDVYSGFQAQVTVAGSQWLLTQGSDESTEWILNLTNGQIQAFKATSLYVEKGNFQMSLNHTWVQIQFIDVTYPANSDWDTHVTYTENVPLSLQDKGTPPKQIFWMRKSTAREMIVNVTETKSAITREIVEDAVAGALAVIAVAGPIVAGLRAAAAIEVVEDAGNAVIAEDAFQAAEEANPEAAEQDAEAANVAAADQAGGRMTSIKAAFKSPIWKAVGWLAGLAGAVAGVDKLVNEILKQAALNEWNDVPGFDDFSQAVIQPYTFPAISGFDLASAGLAGSLQVGLKVKSGGGQ